jgi:3-hydroxyacyl-CoA dehydrogenase
MVVRVEHVGDVAVVTVANPPLNVLSFRVVAALVDALHEQNGDAGVRALVLRGAGRCFSAGVDIAGFNAPAGPGLTLRNVLAALDALGKPVVVALHGLAYGGGLEIALAGDARISSPECVFALPEIQLGLFPGAGGTQRLPRLVGTAWALGFMMEGKPIGAAEAKQAGLVDAVTDGDLTAAAVALAGTATRRRLRDLPLIADPIAIAEGRKNVARRPLRAEALGAIVDCVQAATGDFDAGCRLEQARFDALLTTDVSRALRYAFAAERAVAHVPGLPAPPRPGLRRAAVVGAGTMGTGITLALLGADLPVVLIEPRAEVLARSAAAIRASLENAVARGRLDRATAGSRLLLLSTATALNAAAAADIVIEAVFEDMAVKREVFVALDSIVRDDAVLASNTSTLDIDVLAAGTAHPERVLGTHFFSPAQVMRLLEVVRGERTAPTVLAAVLALARRMGKVGVVAGVCDGFIGNRMFEEYLRQAYFLLDEGALPDQIDAALERWGFALGPLKVMDLAGGDIGWEIRKRRAAEQPDRPYSRLPDLICEQGRFGQKTGRGWYRYPDGRKAESDGEIDALVIAYSAEIGMTRRVIADEEIVERCVLALVNEGAKLLGEGIAMRPLEIDQVFIHGYGFPPERGGPMFHADLLGLPFVLGRINALAQGRDGWAWAPAPLLVDLAAHGPDFATLNAGGKQ